MTKHPKAGHPVKVANGPMKGSYFIVTDWIVNQFQGKSIDKLAVTQGRLLNPVAKRGFPIDDQVVFGRLYPRMEWCCFHDKELQVDMKVIPGEDELPPNVETMAKRKTKKKGKDNGPSTAS